MQNDGDFGGGIGMDAEGSRPDCVDSDSDIDSCGYYSGALHLYSPFNCHFRPGCQVIIPAAALGDSSESSHHHHLRWQGGSHADGIGGLCSQVRLDSWY